MPTIIYNRTVQVSRSKAVIAIVILMCERKKYANDADLIIYNFYNGNFSSSMIQLQLVKYELRYLPI